MSTTEHQTIDPSYGSFTQVMAPLPEVRLEPYNPPFTNAGVYFFGPLIIQRGRGVAKRWGCLITCWTTRAVFLEVAPSLQTDDFTFSYASLSAEEVLQKKFDQIEGLISLERTESCDKPSTS